MKLDISKLKEKQAALEEVVNIEYVSKIPDPVFNLMCDNVINYILTQTKYSKSDLITPRILNSWIKEGVVTIDDADKGKIRRFNKLQCVWLNIADETRKYGMGLEELKSMHSEMLLSSIPNFNYLKHAIISQILFEPQIIEITHSGNFSIVPESYYIQKRTLSLRGFSRIVMPITAFIEREFPKSNLTLPLDIKGAESDVKKLLLLFLLKTSAFKNLKIHLTDSDIRFIENPDSIINNIELKKAIEDWDFDKVEVFLEGGVETIITNDSKL